MPSNTPIQTGAHALPDAAHMSPGAKKLRDTYAIKPDAPVFMKEFGYYSLDRWIREGHIKGYEDLDALCKFDPPGDYGLGNLGWCEGGFLPIFEEKVLEDRGEYEVIQDFAGRHLLVFKGRRNGFMPEYIDHPVKDMLTWERDVKWRMDFGAPGRMEGLQRTIAEAKKHAAQGLMIVANLVGGYMYLRSLMGPEGILYMLYDEPELVRDCMETWFSLADRAYEVIQKEVTIDEFFLGEDICYNHGSLISPDMIKEFLFPYYQQLYTNIKRRNIDRSRHVYFQVDTDGYCLPVIPLYKEIGMDMMSPFEVASNCDVVAARQQYPDLVMSGGMDKREIAKGREAIDRMVDRIMPPLRKSGGYIPTCDHGVPEEVAFEDFLHFRGRLREYSQ